MSPKAMKAMKAKLRNQKEAMPFWTGPVVADAGGSSVTLWSSMADGDQPTTMTRKELQEMDVATKRVKEENEKSRFDAIAMAKKHKEKFGCGTVIYVNGVKIWDNTSDGED